MVVIMCKIHSYSNGYDSNGYGGEIQTYLLYPYNDKGDLGRHYIEITWGFPKLIPDNIGSNSNKCRIEVVHLDDSITAYIHPDYLVCNDRPKYCDKCPNRYFCYTNKLEIYETEEELFTMLKEKNEIKDSTQNSD